MKTRTEGMENENQKFQEAIAYFSQKLEQIGQGVLPDHDFCDGQMTFMYSLPKSETGKDMTLFLDFSPDALDHLRIKDSKRVPTLAEGVYEGLAGRGHVLVQSDELEELVTFKFEGGRLVPESKNSLSRTYAERLEKIASAREGIDLAFEAYRS